MKLSEFTFVLLLLVLFEACSTNQQQELDDSDDIDLENEDIDNGGQQQNQQANNFENNNFENNNFENNNFENNNFEDNDFSENNFGNEDFANENPGQANIFNEDELQFNDSNVEGLNNFLENNEFSQVNENLPAQEETQPNQTQLANDQVIEEQAPSNMAQAPSGNRTFDSSQNAASSVRESETISPFSGSPSLPGSLRNMAAGEAPNEYVVEFGDTLFDICSQLLGEGAYWPKLWSFNTYIKNPHFIWPGMRLRFYPGDEEDPPFIEIAQEEEFEPISANTDLALNAMTNEIVLPDEFGLDPKKVEVLGQNDIPGIENTFETTGWPVNTESVSVTLPGFILPERLEGSCVSHGGINGEAITGEGRRFLCEPNESLSLGKTYTALRYAGEAHDSESSELLGHRYQFVAQVKMTRDLEQEERYIGIVDTSRLGLAKDDLIVPYLPSQRRVSIAEAYSKLSSSDARIIGFEYPGQKIGGTGSLVFINRGADDGIRKGLVYKIAQTLQHELNIELEDPQSMTRNIGLVRIVDVGEIASIGYIVKSQKEVRIGDQLGQS